MTRQRELRFNAFNMTAPSHNWAGLWSHPRDTSIGYNTLDYWVEFAKTAERGLFDGVFLADVFGVYDVFGDSADTAVEYGVQLPNADPTLFVSAMALVTKHLGFGITGNLTLDHPYHFARRFSTLDHLTRGRIGWNIVTGYLESGARGMGFDANRAHDDRYDVAEDFLAATYKLWDGREPDDTQRYAATNRRSRVVECCRCPRAVRGRLAAGCRRRTGGLARATDIDGFNLVRLVAPESLVAFVDLVVPELQSRGLYKTAYRDGTLCEKLFPDGDSLLPTSHPAAQYRQPD